MRGQIYTDSSHACNPRVLVMPLVLGRGTVRQTLTSHPVSRRPKDESDCNLTFPTRKCTRDGRSLPLLTHGVCFVRLRDADRKRLPLPLCDPATTDGSLSSPTLRVPWHSVQNKKCRGCAILHVGQNM